MQIVQPTAHAAVRPPAGQSGHAWTGRVEGRRLAWHAISPQCYADYAGDGRIRAGAYGNFAANG